MSDSQIMKATGQEHHQHHQIVEITLPIAEHIFDNATSFDAGDHILPNRASRGNTTIDEFLRGKARFDSSAKRLSCFFQALSYSENTHDGFQDVQPDDSSPCEPSSCRCSTSFASCYLWADFDAFR